MTEKEFMSGSELRQYLHISTRKMKYLMDNNYIPHENTGLTTHKYRVRTDDAVRFKTRMDTEPGFLSELSGMFSNRTEWHPLPMFEATPENCEAFRRWLDSQWAELPEALPTQTAAELVGHSPQRIHEWIREDVLVGIKLGTVQYCAKAEFVSFIHNDFDAIPITQNYILQFHKILYSHMNNPVAGRTKTVQNYISATYPDGHTQILFTPLSPFETSEALDKICEEYNRVIGNMELEPLIAIPIFIHDFLCIHPFNDGNGRMSRLLTTLLLYQNGFFVGKYISLEAKIAKNKDLYYDALAQSQNGWHEGTENALPFIKYLLGTILAAYKDMDERVALVETKLPALEMVRRASENKIGRFNKQDIRELCPTLSDSSIEGALRKMVSDGELKKEGKGKSTCYFRLK